MSIASQGKSRNYGIDLFRIISMFMVVLLHCLGQGGILRHAVPLSANYELAWFIEISAYCAVDSYALISGYVGYDHKPKYSNLFYIVAQALFYSLTITGLFLLFKPAAVGMGTILTALFPISHNAYWYVTSYFCAFLFFPYLNQIVANMEKQSLQYLLAAMTFIFCILPILWQTDIAFVNWGYSPLWLAFLYLLGGYLRRYGFMPGAKNMTLFLGYLIFGIGTWLFRLLSELVTPHLFGHPVMEDYLIRYNSPTILMCSIFLLLFFSRLDLNVGLVGFTRFFAPATLGVYMLHTEPLVWDHIMKDSLISYTAMSTPLMFLSVLGTATAIWMVCSLLDRCRILIFNSLRIKNFCVLLEKRFYSAIKCISAK